MGESDDLTVVCKENENAKNENLLQKISNFIDSHIRKVRYVSYGVGFIGLVIIARSVRLTKKFKTVREIPEKFIKGNVKLQGIVKDVSEGTLHIEHVPIYRPQLFDIARQDQDLTLPVRLCSVSLSDEASSWLLATTKDRRVWFTLMAVNSQQHLECIVDLRQGLFKSLCVNREVIRQGLATVCHTEGLGGVKMYRTFSEDLVKIQRKAQKKRVGLWQETTTVEKFQSKYQKLLDFLKYKLRSWKK